MDKFKRLVTFKTSGVLRAFNKHGDLIVQREIKEPKTLELAIAPTCTYKFNETEFGVCAGIGELDFLDYPKNLDFFKLKASVIERYLLTQEILEDNEQERLLNEFLETYDKNIEKGYYYLVPRFFKEKESELLRVNSLSDRDKKQAIKAFKKARA